jgi:carbon-monoxide dehydrogenase small subunit
MKQFESKGLILNLNINGVDEELYIEGPHITLADVLRNKLFLTGTKEACRCGECGSCTVLVEGMPALACSTLAVAVRGKEIVTIEGIATHDGLHPIQQAFIDGGAVQCGFCTPGMILMAKALLDANPDPTEIEIKEQIGGNLCRCTGYIKIIESIRLAAGRMREGA